MSNSIQKNNIQIRFAGVGGQGLQAAATVLGKSFIISSKKYVCQTQNYGPESRGGLSYSDLIISDDEIDFPKIKIPDVLVCMSQESFLRFRPEMVNGSIQILVIDPEMVKIRDLPRKNPHLPIYSISATLASEEIVGSRISANMVLVGVLVSILKIGNPKSVEQVLKEEWPDLAEKNILAFRRGMELDKESQI
jgi:2-oxoglutarate ferredoxin oxidoreductase subunit gamma